MSWNNNHEQIVINIGEQCAGYQWMLTKTTQSNLFYYRLFGIAAIPFTVISGTGYFAIEEEIRVQEIIFGIFGVLAGILLSLQQFMNYRDDNQQYISLANKFQEIYNEVTYILSAEREKRVDPNEYIPNLLQKYDIICDSRPVISGYVTQLYRQHLKTEGIKMAVPDVVGDVRPILVNNEENNKELELEEVNVDVSDALPNPRIPRDKNKGKHEFSILERADWMHN